MATREPTAEDLLREAIELYRDGIAASKQARPAQPEKRRRGFWYYSMNILVALFLIVFLVVVGIEFFLPMFRPEGIVVQPLSMRTPAPLPTAVLPQSPAQQYQAPPVQQQPAPTAVPQAPPAAPQAPAVVEQVAPQVAPQSAPVEAPAPLPAPADPAFEASFEIQSDAANNLFVGCLPGRDCNPSYSQPTALPGPNDPGFAESFK